MCDIAILENSGTLKSVIDYYKNQEMCNKVVDNYPYALEFVPGCFKTQIMCDKAVDTHPTAINMSLVAIRLKKHVIMAAHRCFLYFILFLINIKFKRYVT